MIWTTSFFIAAVFGWSSFFVAMYLLKEKHIEAEYMKAGWSGANERTFQAEQRAGMLAKELALYGSVAKKDSQGATP